MRKFFRFKSYGAALAATAMVMAADAGLARTVSDPSGQAEPPPRLMEKRLLFALIYRPGPEWRPGKPFREQVAIKGHFAYMKDLFAKGQVFAAGGMGSENGLVLFYARDQAEAESILAADPMVQAGSFAGDVRLNSPAFLSDGPLTATKD